MKFRREIENCVCLGLLSLVRGIAWCFQSWGDSHDDEHQNADVWDLAGLNAGTKQHYVTQASNHAAVSGSSVLGSNSPQKSKNTEGSRPVDDHGSNFSVQDLSTDAIIFPNS